MRFLNSKLDFWPKRVKNLETLNMTRVSMKKQHFLN